MSGKVLQLSARHELWWVQRTYLRSLGGKRLFCGSSRSKTINEYNPTITTKYPTMMTPNEVMEQDTDGSTHDMVKDMVNQYGDNPDYMINLEVMKRNKETLTLNSVNCAKSFLPRTSDIIVNTFPKSGTTWTGFIVHLIRSYCNISTFNEMEQLMTLLIAAKDTNVDLNANDPNGFDPRLFMMHASLVQDMPAKVIENSCGNKNIIHVIRDPKTTALSLYYHIPRLALIHPHDCDMDIFFELNLLGETYRPLGCVYESIPSWINEIYKNNSKNNNILLLFYEDLLQDRMKCIEKIIDFMDKTNDKKIDKNKVFEMSSREYMSNINDKFRFGAIFRRWLNQSPQLKEFYYDSQNGQCKRETGFEGTWNHGVGTNVTTDVNRKVLTPLSHQRCDQLWMEKVKPLTGCDNYQQLRQKYSFLYNGI